MEIKNTVPILTELLNVISDLDIAGNIYLSRVWGKQINSCEPEIALNGLGIKELPLPGVLYSLGICSTTLSSFYDFDNLYNLKIPVPEGQFEQNLLPSSKREVIIKGLSSLFRNCRTIAFDDWSSVTAAADLWVDILHDIIKPLGRNDLEFIFYLGDPEKKINFEVGEMLDIFSAFSLYGKATLILDDNEATKLWMVLNGVEKLPESAGFADLKNKYFSIFRTMSLARLLIYSPNETLLFSKIQQFVLERKKLDYRSDIGSAARRNFMDGFCIGLGNGLDIAHCIALGIVVLGSYEKLNAGPDKKDMIQYIQKWIEDLDKPESIHLYQ
jgi:hypothetical protein